MKCLVRFLIIGLVYLLVLSTIVFPVNCIMSLGNFSNDTITSSGNTYYVGGTGPNNYTKIQEAIDNASNGDTVFVYDDSSPYYENVIINKSINLIGENRDTTIIDGNNQDSVVYITADYVTIRFFTLRNSGDQATHSDAGLHIRSDYNTIADNKIINNLGGIHLKTSRSNTISDNIISNNKEGIHLSDWTYGHIISRNTISENNGDGIICGGFFENYGHTIVENNIENNNPGCGIYFAWSSYNTISNNTIIGNFYHGIHLTSYSSDMHISGNIISYSSRGIDIGYSSEIVISKNVIENNYYGIYIVQSQDSEINLNDIQNSVNIGVIILNGSRIKIYHNNIINNKPNAFFINSDQIEWAGNYWNRGRLLPKPILGFKTIIINEDKFLFFPTIAFDMNPAHYPYEI